MSKLFVFAAAVVVAPLAIAGEQCSSQCPHSQQQQVVVTHDYAVTPGVPVHTVSHHEGSASKTPDIVDTAASLKDFSTLVAAVKAAGLVDALKSEGPFTVFAPTNAAFEKLPEGTVASLLKPENKQQLTDILLYHVVPAKVLAKDVVTVDSADTLLKDKAVKVTVKDGEVFINQSKVVKTDVMTSNGVIHVVDTVILP